MKQKKSLLALTLVFALVFTSFVGIGNAEAKNSKLQKDVNVTKPLKNKNFKISYSKKHKKFSFFKKNKKSPNVKICQADSWKYIRYSKKKPATTVICSKAMFKTLSPKNKRKVRRIEKKLRAQLQRALLAEQYVQKDKTFGEHEAWFSVPLAKVACQIANRENQKLYKYNIKARKINKARYRAAKKRWKKRHKRGKIRYRKMKIKKYLDAQKLCKNASQNFFDIDYNLEKNDSMPVHDSAQVKLSWKAPKTGNIKYRAIKIDENQNDQSIIKGEKSFTTSEGVYEDTKKYTPQDIFEVQPSVYFVYTYKNNKIFSYQIKDEKMEHEYCNDLIYKLAKVDDNPEFKKTGVGFCEGLNYFSLLELNDLRKQNGLYPLEYSAEMNKYANIRARESFDKYDHTRPNGKDWTTVFPEDKTCYLDNLKKSPSKWALLSENLGPTSMYMFWLSRPHRNALSSTLASHVAIGNYFIGDGHSILIAIPISTGDKGIEKIDERIKKWEEWEKNKETISKEALSKCGINFEDHLNEKDWIYEKLAPEGKLFADPKLIKEVYYKGMPLKIYDEIEEEISKIEYTDNHLSIYEKLYEIDQIWQKWIDKHKQYK